MRRRRSRLPAVVVATAVLLGTASTASDAQTGVATEGAVFLLLPVGARAVGLGHAVIAEGVGSEAIWWNPAGLARLDRYEASIHHSQSLAATGDAVSVILPFSVIGVFGLSANVLNFGEQQITDNVTGEPIGIQLIRSFVFAATYSTTIGEKVNAGINYKVVQFRNDCSGACVDVPEVAATTSALDLGMQYDLSPLSPVTIGVAVRNLGLRVQVKDSEQADPLPTRVQLGVAYRLPPIEQLRETELRVSGDLVDQLRIRSPSGRVGVELLYQKRYSVRAGYVLDDGGGPAIGAGVTAGGLLLDIARVMGGELYSGVEGAPIHVSLRYLF